MHSFETYQNGRIVNSMRKHYQKSNQETIPKNNDLKEKRILKEIVLRSSAKCKMQPPPLIIIKHNLNIENKWLLKGARKHQRESEIKRQRSLRTGH